MEPLCKGKYQFNTKNKVIGLPIKLENLPQELEIEGNKLVSKTTFHVSLVCIGKIIEKYHISDHDFETKIVEDFCEFVKNNEIKILEYKDFRFAEENDLKTVVVMCRVSNLDKFFDFFNKKYNSNVEYPPTHITLYTLTGKLGIFLTDLNDIKNLTKPITNPIGRQL